MDDKLIVLCLVTMIMVMLSFGMIIYCECKVFKLTLKKYFEERSNDIKAFFKMMKNGWHDLFSNKKSYKKLIEFLKITYDYIVYLSEKYFRKIRKRHCFEDALWSDFESIINDYCYQKLGFVMDYYVRMLPSYIYISFNTKQIVKLELVQEVVQHIIVKFQQYLYAYGLDFAFYPDYVFGQYEIKIFIYYCEYKTELDEFNRKVNEIKRKEQNLNSGSIEIDVDPRKRNKEVLLGYSNTAWHECGLKKELKWNYIKTPHLLIFGLSGGGKSVLAQFIVAQLMERHAELYICDYKADCDWSDIIPKYAKFNDCDRLVNEFYGLFEDAMNTGNKKERFLVFDEFSSYAQSKSSHEFNELMMKIRNIALMGRSYYTHLILISQQFNSRVVETSIREQFGVKIYMGSRISTESAMMLFPNCEIDKSVALEDYSGYISLPGEDLDIIKMPTIKHVENLKQYLIELGEDYRQ